MPFKNEQLWLGTQQSYEKALEAVAKAEADPKFSASSDYNEDVMKQIMQVQDGIATVNISGSLVNGSAGYAVYYGVTGYDDIRNALALAVSNPNVSAILLNVSSGGGQVAGVHETAQLISRVAKVKPVVTYTGSMMGSAALWAGISGNYAFSAETAIVGSIGIIMVHMDRSKQLEEMGVKATVIRAGSEKALASPYESLSEKAKETLQAQATDLYDIFIGHVASARGMSVTAADSKFGQGREFLGKQAVAAGLVDAVGSFEDAFAKAAKLGSVGKSGVKRTSGSMKASNSSNVQALASDSAASTVDNQATHEGTPMPKSLTQEQLAAMAAGVELEVTDTSAATEASTEQKEDEPASDSSAAPEASNTAAVLVPEATLIVVQDMLKSAQADLVTARMEAQTAIDKLAESADSLVKFAEIARASVKTMGVHFGVKSDAVAAMSNTEVLAEHSRLAALFKDKFKVGGVAAAASDNSTSNSAKLQSMAPALAEIAMSLPGAK